MLRRPPPDVRDVRCDAFGGVTPEEMYIAVYGRDFPGIFRSAAQIEPGMRLLQRLRGDAGPLQLMIPAVEI